MQYIFSNIIGIFIFDENNNVRYKEIFKDVEEYKNKDRIIENIRDKFPDAKEPQGKEFGKIVLYFKSKDFFGELQKRNVEITRQDLRDSVTDDILIIQSIGSIEDTDKSTNHLIKRLREWYELYNPEFSRKMTDNEKFVELILKKDKIVLLKEINVDAGNSMGSDLRQEDLEAIRNLASQVDSLYHSRKKQEEYIESLMKRFCPNLAAVAGTLIGAKLLQEAGSLKKLSRMPASTIQILGAEKALFRHMKTGAKPPRHGIIVAHSLISRAPQKEHGKRARALADKICLACKIDYFKGEFIGDKLRKELEDKFLK